MRFLKRILTGWRITLPIGGRRIAIPIVLTSLLLCCCGTTVISMIDNGDRQAGLAPTSTPRPVETTAPLATRTPRPTATNTAIPTATAAPEATATPTHTAEPTATPRPPAAPVTTVTPLLPTAPAPTEVPVRAAPVIVLPSAPAVPSAATSNCDCSTNLYNCADFTEFDAQSCYMRCLEITGEDIHDLDRDHDGSACEWSY